MEEKSATKPPRTKNGDDTERKLGTALSDMRIRLINPYLRDTNRRKKKRI